MKNSIILIVAILILSGNINAETQVGRVKTTNEFSEVLKKVEYSILTLNLDVQRYESKFQCCVSNSFYPEKYCESKNLTTVLTFEPKWAAEIENPKIFFECVDIDWINYTIYSERVVTSGRVLFLSFMVLLALICFSILVLFAIPIIPVNCKKGNDVKQQIYTTKYSELLEKRNG